MGVETDPVSGSALSPALAAFVENPFCLSIVVVTSDFLIHWIWARKAFERDASYAGLVYLTELGSRIYAMYEPPRSARRGMILAIPTKLAGSAVRGLDTQVGCRR